MAVVVRRSGKMAEVLADLTKRVEKKTVKALYAAAYYVYGRSQELVPIDTLALQESGQVRPVSGAGFTTVMVVGYGKPGFSKTEFSKKEHKLVTRVPNEYVVWVHEHPNRAHDSGRTYEFLAIPLRTERYEIVRAIGVALASNGKSS